MVSSGSVDGVPGVCRPVGWCERVGLVSGRLQVREMQLHVGEPFGLRSVSNAPEE